MSENLLCLHEIVTDIKYNNPDKEKRIILLRLRIFIRKASRMQRFPYNLYSRQAGEP